MNEVSIIGVDLAKNVFQLHGSGADGSVLFRRQVRRAQFLEFFEVHERCIVAMEACASAHHWGRQLQVMGYEVCLIAPAYVKPFVKRQKNDAADAEAIAEAASRPTMRFVAVKGAEKQSEAMILKTRDLLVRQKTQTINALRGHLAEYGVVAPKGTTNLVRLKEALADDGTSLPPAVVAMGKVLVDHIEALEKQITGLTRQIEQRARTDDTSKRLMNIPGVASIIAVAITALAPPPEMFKNGRGFAAWIGLTQKQNSTGGKTVLGRTSKMGQRDLRRLLVVGATSVVSAAGRWGTRDPWLTRMLVKGKPRKLIAVALAARMARVAWVLLHRGGVYETPVPIRAA